VKKGQKGFALDVSKIDALIATKSTKAVRIVKMLSRGGTGPFEWANQCKPVQDATKYAKVIQNARNGISIAPSAKPYSVSIAGRWTSHRLVTT